MFGLLKAAYNVMLLVLMNIKKKKEKENLISKSQTLNMCLKVIDMRVCVQ